MPSNNGFPVPLLPVALFKLSKIDVDADREALRNVANAVPKESITGTPFTLTCSICKFVTRPD